VEIKTPYVIMFRDEETKNVICHLYPSGSCDTYQAYGLLVCDLVRHVAKCFEVEEQQFWEWVDAERVHPTTQIMEPPGKN
jgi:hypothetical protein